MYLDVYTQNILANQIVIVNLFRNKGDSLLLHNETFESMEKAQDYFLKEVKGFKVGVYTDLLSLYRILDKCRPLADISWELYNETINKELLNK